MTTSIRVISLVQATGRREKFAARAADAAVPWSFFDACTKLPPDMSYDEDDTIVAKGRPLQPGELGVYASHWVVWQEFLASDHDFLIVFEDDTIVDWNYIAAMATPESAARRFDYLRLFNLRPSLRRTICRGLLRPNDHVIELEGLVYGAQGYLIGRRAAETFIKHCRRVRRTIDDEMDRSWDHGVPNLAVFPAPLMEEFVPSQIGSARSEPFTVPGRLQIRRLLSRADNGLRIRAQTITRRGLYRG